MDIKRKELDIDLRVEMQELIEDYAYHALLVRTSDMSCSCTEGQSQQYSTICPICLGTAKRIRLERINVISKLAIQTTRLVNATIQSKLGEISSDSKVFYIKYNIKPSVGSLICEVSWKNNKPVSILGVYKIEYTVPLRMEHGRSEYAVVVAHREVTNVDFREKTIRTMKIHVRE